MHLEGGDLDAAARCYEQVLSRSRVTGYAVGEAMAVGNLGVIALERESLDEGEAFFRQAHALHKGLGNPDAQASTLGNLGLVATRLSASYRGRVATSAGRLNQALDHHYGS